MISGVLEYTQSLLGRGIDDRHLTCPAMLDCIVACRISVREFMACQPSTAKFFDFPNSDLCLAEHSSNSEALPGDKRSSQYLRLHPRSRLIKPEVDALQTMSFLGVPGAVRARAGLYPTHSRIRKLGVKLFLTTLSYDSVRAIVADRLIFGHAANSCISQVQVCHRSSLTARKDRPSPLRSADSS
jgi:hypothetical protein